MLWTAAAMVGSAVLALVGGAWRGRRRRVIVPTISFAPLANPAIQNPATMGRTAIAPAFAPPAPLAAGAPLDGPDQRVDFRRPGNPVLVLVADSDQQRNPWNAWVVDRSRRGLRLAVERPLVVGSVYTVRPIQAAPATPWIALEVRHCSEIDGHWEAGCRFLQPPPVAVLLLYG
jgi:hypothetical protein